MYSTHANFNSIKVQLRQEREYEVQVARENFNSIKVQLRQTAD